MKRLLSVPKWRGFGMGRAVVLGTLIILGALTAIPATFSNISAHGGDTTVVHACVNDTTADTRIIHPGPGNADIDCVNPPWPLGAGWSPVDLDDDWSGAGSGSLSPANLTDNVGIGTATPDNALHIKGSGTDGITLERSSAAQDTQIKFQNEIGADKWWISFDGDLPQDLFLFPVGSEQDLILQANEAGASFGNVGIGTTAPETTLHVQGARAGDGAFPAANVAVLEETSGSILANVLLLKVGQTDPMPRNNFITFVNGNNSPVGAIEGNGSGGVTYKSGAADFAEWLPRLNPHEIIEPGDIVAIKDGKISKITQGADQVQVISTAPIVLGNMPDAASEHLYEKVAFLGQVPVKVRGIVRSGDYIVPSGFQDGTGVAVPSQELAPAHYAQIVGRAWESSDETGVKLINAAVGLNDVAPALVHELRTERQRLEDLQTKIAELEAQLASLAEVVADVISPDNARMVPQKVEALKATVATLTGRYPEVE